MQSQQRPQLHMMLVESSGSSMLRSIEHCPTVCVHSSLCHALMQEAQGSNTPSHSNPNDTQQHASTPAHNAQRHTGPHAHAALDADSDQLQAPQHAAPAGHSPLHGALAHAASSVAVHLPDIISPSRTHDAGGKHAVQPVHVPEDGSQMELLEAMHREHREMGEAYEASMRAMRVSASAWCARAATYRLGAPKKG